jgi:hypothetical protein
MSDEKFEMENDEWLLLLLYPLSATARGERASA